MTLQTRLMALVARVLVLGLGEKAVLALRALVDEAEDLQRAAISRGRRARAPRSAKAKGRDGVVLAREWILRWFPTLAQEDILIQTTSVGGSDLHYSPLAASIFPFAPEIKNVESLNVWAALRQAEINATKRRLQPVLFFKRNRTEMWVAFPCRDLHRLRDVAPGEGYGETAGRRAESHREEDPRRGGV